MVVTFWGKGFGCRNVYILADSKKDFFFPPSLHPHQGLPSLCGVCHPKLALIKHPQQTHNSYFLGAGS